MSAEDQRPSETSFAPGALIAGKFRIERKLGEGGMGAVYAALNEVTNRAVALKVMHVEFASRKDIVRRFQREAKATSSISHPNIIEVLDLIEGPFGSPIMVMELLEGEPLSELLERRGVLRLAEVASLMVPVISAVGAAHARGIIHRDLKPENVFLLRRPDGSYLPKVLDFGIAKILDPSQINELVTQSGMTRTGAMLGTPHYMSIEQACGEKDIDHRTDIWSVGVMLYVMLSGRHPYDGANYGQILKALVTETPAALDKLVPELPPDVVDIVDRCMRKSRQDRPNDLREVHLVLSRYGGDKPVAAPPSMSTMLRQADADIGSGPTLQAASVYTEGPLEQQTLSSRPTTSKLVLWGLGVLLLLATGTGVVSLRHRQANAVAATPEPSAGIVLAAASVSTQPAVTVPPQASAPSSASASASAAASEVPSASASSGRTGRKPTGVSAGPSSATSTPPAAGNTQGGRGIIEDVPY